MKKLFKKNCSGSGISPLAFVGLKIKLAQAQTGNNPQQGQMAVPALSTAQGGSRRVLVLHDVMTSCLTGPLMPIFPLLRNNVTTPLLHAVFFHMIRCGYAIPMFLPNLKQIGQETRPQRSKNRQN